MRRFTNLCTESISLRDSRFWQPWHCSWRVLVRVSSDKRPRSTRSPWRSRIRPPPGKFTSGGVGGGLLLVVFLAVYIVFHLTSRKHLSRCWTRPHSIQSTKTCFYTVKLNCEDLLNPPSPPPWSLTWRGPTANALALKDARNQRALCGIIYLP